MIFDYTINLLAKEGALGKTAFDNYESIMSPNTTIILKCQLNITGHGERSMEPCTGIGEVVYHYLIRRSNNNAVALQQSLSGLTAMSLSLQRISTSDNDAVKHGRKRGRNDVVDSDGNIDRDWYYQREWHCGCSKALEKNSSNAELVALIPKRSNTSNNDTVKAPCFGSYAFDTNAWGTVDIIYENVNKTHTDTLVALHRGGLYRLNINANASIPIHYHQLMYECEMLVSNDICVSQRNGMVEMHSDTGTLQETRSNNIVYVHGHNSRHGYENETNQSQSPPFIPIDEVVCQDGDKVVTNNATHKNYVDECASKSYYQSLIPSMSKSTPTAQYKTTQLCVHCNVFKFPGSWPSQVCTLVLCKHAAIHMQAVHSATALSSTSSTTSTASPWRKPDAVLVFAYIFDSSGIHSYNHKNDVDESLKCHPAYNEAVREMNLPIEVAEKFGLFTSEQVALKRQTAKDNSAVEAKECCIYGGIDSKSDNNTDNSEDAYLCLVRHVKRGWELPGGKIEEGEEAISAAKRELWEEARVEVRNNEIQCLGQYCIDDGTMTHVKNVYMTPISKITQLSNGVIGGLEGNENIKLVNDTDRRMFRKLTNIGTSSMSCHCHAMITSQEVWLPQNEQKKIDKDCDIRAINSVGFSSLLMDNVFPLALPLVREACLAHRSHHRTNPDTSIDFL